MKMYEFPVDIVETLDGWHVCCPDLEHKGAATWGATREEALRNIQEVVQMVIEKMIEEGETLPPN